MNLGKRIAIGALGGVAGAFVMSLIMAAGKKMGFVHDPIPHRIEGTIERRLGKAHKTSREQEALTAHSPNLSTCPAIYSAFCKGCVFA